MKIRNYGIYIHNEGGGGGGGGGGGCGRGECAYSKDQFLQFKIKPP